MNREKVEEQLEGIFRSVLREKAPAAISGDESNWDSLENIELIFAVEAKFAVQFDSEELADLVTFSSICDAVFSKKNES